MASVPAVSTRVNTTLLRRHLALRGWTATELAARSGLSEATCSHAQTGKNISEKSLRKMCLALAKEEPLPNAEELIALDL